MCDRHFIQPLLTIQILCVSHITAGIIYYEGRNTFWYLKLFYYKGNTDLIFLLAMWEDSEQLNVLLFSVRSLLLSGLSVSIMCPVMLLVNIHLLVVPQCCTLLQKCSLVTSPSVLNCSCCNRHYRPGVKFVVQAFHREAIFLATYIYTSLIHDLSINALLVTMPPLTTGLKIRKRSTVIPKIPLTNTDNYRN